MLRLKGASFFYVSWGGVFFFELYWDVLLELVGNFSLFFKKSFYFPYFFITCSVLALSEGICLGVISISVSISLSEFIGPRHYFLSFLHSSAYSTGLSCSHSIDPVDSSWFLPSWQISLYLSNYFFVFYKSQVSFLITMCKNSTFYFPFKLFLLIVTLIFFARSANFRDESVS